MAPALSLRTGPDGVRLLDLVRCGVPVASLDRNVIARG
jgi:hypothetical protein